MKILACMLVLGSSLAAAAPPPCPAAVTTAIDKRFPKSTLQACKAEREDGHDQFEVKLTKADGSKVEVDVSPAGAILQTEEVIALDQVPAAVTKAFAAKYPKAKPTRAEKQTPATGKPSYELAFAVDGKRKEATFAEDGTFVEEE
ncbi:MAG TPA: hypothetical protein VFQ65_01210 [Kofleriaceae bacterium]|nr:hypothetical protein [Kofleriaceae bacterium]